MRRQPLNQQLTGDFPVHLLRKRNRMQHLEREEQQRLYQARLAVLNKENAPNLSDSCSSESAVIQYDDIREPNHEPFKISYK